MSTSMSNHKQHVMSLSRPPRCRAIKISIKKKALAFDFVVNNSVTNLCPELIKCPLDLLLLPVFGQCCLKQPNGL